MILYYFILLCSILLNVFLLYLYFIPSLDFYLTRRYINRRKNKVMLENVPILAVTAAVTMMQSKRNYMPIDERSHLVGELLKILNFKKNYHIKKFFFPRAFLFYALSEYGKKDKKYLYKVKKYFDTYIDESGTPLFKISTIDQTVWGLVAINLYIHFKEDKYAKFADFIFHFICSNKIDDIVIYRLKSSCQFVDVLGMISPFLIMYYKVFENENSRLLLYKTVLNYIDNGVDKTSFLPFHAYNMNNKIKLGPTNWGRGICWYMFALSFILKHDDRKDSVEYQKINHYYDKLMLCYETLENKYSQFPGLSYCSIDFDSSVWTMYWASKKVFDPNINPPYSEIYKYINSKGFVMSASGDTHSINDYSRVASYSELAQAMFLLTL